MSHQSHTASSQSSSVLRQRGRNEHPTLRRGGESQEVRQIAVELEQDSLVRKLAQLQKDFDKFRRTTILVLPGTQSPSPILEVWPQ